jgi:small-conductance mechanosensitive channel
MVEDWLNLGGSVLFVAIGSLVAIPMLFGLLNWAVRRSKIQFDDAFLDRFGREFRWLVVVLLVRVAVLRLVPLRGWLRIHLEDILFLLAWGVLYVISLRLIAFGADWYQAHRVPEANRKRLNPFIEMVKRLGYLFTTTLALGFVLSHYGINVTAPAAAIFFVLVVVALAAREAITDSVAGSFILLNQPFRVGDDIHLKELDTWGAVQEIGIRITRILTLDNREVIIPNSLIGQSQVVNYSDPDPSLRVQTDFGVAYGTDLSQADRVIEAAVRGVEGVLPDKPVEVWFMKFGDYARRIRVLWWIDDISHEYPIRNHVNRAIELALSEAGIECPFPTYNLNLGAEAENVGPATRALSDGDG